MPFPELQSAVGLVALVAIAWALSENKRAFPLGLVAIGLALQIVLALFLLKTPGIKEALFGLTSAVDALIASRVVAA